MGRPVSDTLIIKDVRCPKIAQHQNSLGTCNNRAKLGSRGESREPAAPKINIGGGGLPWALHYDRDGNDDRDAVRYVCTSVLKNKCMCELYARKIFT